MKNLQILVLIVASLVSLKVYSYKEPTHQDLSSNALEISKLSQDQAFLSDLGLRAFSSNQKFLNPDDPNGKKLSITELVRNGAKFEDNTPRFLNHFYNPINNTPLTIGFLGLGLTSPEWALEDVADVDPNINGPQSYSYKDAMNYFFLALTTQTEEIREQNWGKMFQALGQVIHHVQDMAQPDHVRNDQHNDATDSSWYEEYTNDHKNDAYFTNLMTGGTIPIPEFTTARDFWTTRATDSIVTGRRGIADFTNRNFVSKESIFLLDNGVIVPTPQYPLPTPSITPTTFDIADPSIKGAQGQVICDQIKALSLITFPNSACFIDFVSTPITGAVAGESTINKRAASYSIFDKKLVDHNVDSIYTHEDGSIDTIDRSFTLNEFNFKAAHQYLIPRAVSYSAGLINHFFKAKFEVTVDHINKAFVIKNLSGSVMHGQFQLYVETIDGVRVLNQAWNISDYTTVGLENNTEISIPVPDLAQYGRILMFTYRGHLGNEMDLEHVSGYQIYLQDRSGGYLSQVSKRESREGDLPDNNTQQFSVNKYSYKNLKLDQFVTNFMFFNEIVTPVPPYNRSIIDKYIVNNFYTTIRADSTSYCVIEAIGTWSGLADIFDGYGFIFSVAITEDDFRGIGDDIGRVLGLDVPDAAECLSIPYGYRSATWSDGWISKYPRAISSNNDLAFRMLSIHNDWKIVQLTGNLEILDQGVCRSATIEDVNNSWPENSNDGITGYASTHEFADQNALLNANVHGYLDTYIPQNILDYSCL